MSITKETKHTVRATSGAAVDIEMINFYIDGGQRVGPVRERMVLNPATPQATIDAMPADIKAVFNALQTTENVAAWEALNADPVEPEPVGEGE